jgi:hypothetical protein
LEAERWRPSTAGGCRTVASAYSRRLGCGSQLKLTKPMFDNREPLLALIPEIAITQSFQSLSSRAAA